MPKPRCIIITGRPGSGKTTLAQQLAAKLSLPLISRDVLKEGYVNTYGISHNELPDNTNSIVTEFFFEIVGQYLSGKVSVIIEAAFQHKLWAHYFQKIEMLSIPSMILCELEPKLAAERHLQRGLADSRREFFHGDARVTHFRETGKVLSPEIYVAPELEVPTMKVSTIKDYDPPIEEIIAFMLNGTGRYAEKLI